MDGLGKFKVPIEVIPYLKELTKKKVETAGGLCQFRNSGEFLTDNGNTVMDCDFGKIAEPHKLERKLKLITGVVEVGIFTGITSLVILGGEQGVRKLTFSSSVPE